MKLLKATTLALLALMVVAAPAIADNVIWEDKNLYLEDGFLSAEDGVKARGNISREDGVGGKLNIKVATAETTLSGATTATSGLIASDSIVLGCAFRVTTTVTGATTFTIGDGSDADKFGTGILLPAGTVADEDDWTAATLPLFYTSFNITFTAAGSDFTGGVVRTACYYIEIDAPGE